MYARQSIVVTRTSGGSKVQQRQDFPRSRRANAAANEGQPCVAGSLGPTPPAAAYRATGMRFAPKRALVGRTIDEGSRTSRSDDAQLCVVAKATTRSSRSSATSSFQCKVITRFASKSRTGSAHSFAIRRLGFLIKMSAPFASSSGHNMAPIVIRLHF